MIPFTALTHMLLESEPSYDSFSNSFSTASGCIGALFRQSQALVELIAEL